MDQNNKVYLTTEGLENLKKEFTSLTEVRRPVAVERLSNARNAGDLAENSDYAQAKQDLAYIDGRISELEEVLSKVTIIEENKSKHNEVGLGCKVTVEINNQKHVFHLVGEWEANPIEKKISHDSPLGKALMGKKVGEQVEVDAPAGKVTYKIIKID